MKVLRYRFEDQLSLTQCTHIQNYLVELLNPALSLLMQTVADARRAQAVK